MAFKKILNKLNILSFTVDVAFWRHFLISLFIDVNLVFCILGIVFNLISLVFIVLILTWSFI